MSYSMERKGDNSLFTEDMMIYENSAVYKEGVRTAK